MRRFIGCSFIIGGILGFLPVLGFWMLPVGLVILSRDSRRIRRSRRRVEIMLLRRWQASRFCGKANRGRKKNKVAVRIT